MFFEYWTISSAISVSLIRDSADWVFSLMLSRLATVCSNLFWTAPNFERKVDNFSIELCTVVIALCAFVAVLTFKLPIRLEPTTDFNALIAIEIVWLAFAPTCKAFFVPAENPPSKIFILLNCVVEPTLWISVFNCWTSSLRAVLSVVAFVPFAAWTASSLILWSIECTSFKAPSAVCTKEIPSWALSDALLRPLIWFLIFSEIERPAASSAARLIL